MLLKFGDPTPITVIKPTDIDDENTKKSLKKAIKTVKEKLQSPKAQEIK
jgi:hypothetical protein